MKTLTSKPSISPAHLTSSTLAFMTTLFFSSIVVASGTLGAGSSHFSGLNTVANEVFQFITGPFAITAGAIAVVFFGYKYMTSDDGQAVSRGIKILVVLALIFGAKQFVELASGATL